MKRVNVDILGISQCMKVKSESEVTQSDSVRPHRLQPIRLLHPWDFLGKSTGVGCHCPLRESPLGLVKTQIAEPALIGSDSVGLRWGPRTVLLAS